jgi:hypothetical protein
MFSFFGRAGIRPVPHPDFVDFTMRARPLETPNYF